MRAIMSRRYRGGTGFGGDHNDFDSERRQRALVRQTQQDAEMASYLNVVNQTLVFGTRGNDAAWLCNFLQSSESQKLVETLKDTFRNQVPTDWSTRKQLYTSALQVCTTLSADLQLATLFEDPKESDSLLNCLLEFAHQAELVAQRSADSDMHDLLLATQVLEAKDSAERAVSQLQQQQQEQQSYYQSRATSTAASASASTPANVALPPPVAINAGTTSTSLPDEDYYKQQLGPLRFELVHSLTDHAFDDCAAPGAADLNTRQVFRELASYRTTLPVEYGSGIFVRALDHHISVIRALIVGPQHTPYAHGAFVFDVWLPPSYPSVPPKIILKTTGSGQVRFNPNLYANGKVCLSLLGTWEGPSWIAGESTLLQVLVSIQSLILVPDPYFNEPGWEAQRDTAQGKACSEAYNRQLQFQTQHLCIQDFLEQLVNGKLDYPEFETVLLKHFLVKKNAIETQSREWARLDTTLSSSTIKVCRLLQLLAHRHPGIAAEAAVPNVARMPAPETAPVERYGARMPQWGSTAPSVARKQSASNLQQEVSANNDSHQQQNADTIKFTVTVPANIRPGEKFDVLAMGKIRNIVCPTNGKPGQTVEFHISKSVLRKEEAEAPLPEEELTSENVVPIHPDGSQGYIVSIPPHVAPGEQFHVMINGQAFFVTRPATSGRVVKIFPPSRSSSRATSRSSSPRSTSPNVSGHNSNQEEEEQAFYITIPPGVQSGQRFAIDRDGSRLVVTCPHYARQGDVVRYRVTISATAEPHCSPVESPSLQVPPQQHTVEPMVRFAAPSQQQEEVAIYYNSTEEWARVLSLDDRKFYWTFIGSSSSQADTPRLTFARKLVMMDNNSGHRAGFLSLVNVQDADYESCAKTNDGNTLVAAQDLAQVQDKPAEERFEWFRQQCCQLRVGLEEGHMIVNVRPKFLLTDSVKAIMSMSRRDLRKVWKFKHVGGDYLDNLQEFQWFQSVMKDLFDPDLGLWQYSNAVKQLRMQVHPASEFCCEDHLLYFRFCGRVLGKSLLEGRHLISAPLDPYIYKLLLGWPIQYKDLEHVNKEHYKHLQMLESWSKRGEGSIELLCLYFTTTSEVMGKNLEVPLEPGGADKKVTSENFQQYLDASLKYRMVESVKPQLTELLLGFFDVIPEALLAVFDYKELEQLLMFRATTPYDAF